MSQTEAWGRTDYLAYNTSFGLRTNAVWHQCISKGTKEAIAFRQVIHL